jgi:nucleotide-binding universal stress UspA family protein
MYKKLLVPIDGSGPSTAALNEVVKIMADRTRLIRLIHVVDLIHWSDNFSAGSLGDTFLASLRETGQRHLDEGKDVIAHHGFDCDIALLDSHGERAAGIIISHATLWSADLIVMGTHGRRGLTRLILGSDAAQVVHAAPTPVLLVRDNQR